MLKLHGSSDVVGRPQGQRHGGRGATAVEYALMVALIAVVIILAVTFIGTSASTKFSQVGSASTAPVRSSGPIERPSAALAAASRRRRRSRWILE